MVLCDKIINANQVGVVNTYQTNGEYFRHQVQHYTNQLAKDTNKYIKDLAHAPATPTQSEQKQRRMHKERLMNEFSTALNNFQAAQRNAAEKEKASVKRARAASGLGVSNQIKVSFGIVSCYITTENPFVSDKYICLWKLAGPVYG